MEDNQTQNTEVKEIVQPETQSTAIPDIEQDTDWRRVRDQRKADRKAREEAEARAMQKAEEAAALKAALEAIANKPSPVFNTTYQDESEEARLDRLVEEKLQKREKEREREMNERALKEAPAQLLRHYPDYNQICSPENLDYIDYHHPELTAPYKYMPEGYEKWELMYKATKKLLPNLNAKKDAQKVDQNLAKPQSVSSIPNVPATGHAVKLSEERRAENWARMQKSLKGLS